ncbi:uncharacterized protein LOC135499730 [Lineus longissimus]|uniref:uncharacterized protein LOC135499730 n=1 Tax=Lineus longissimus TaxID=88925 RepID=UPI00315CDBCD
MKPMTDLCWTCQQNSKLLLKSVNRTTTEKSDALKTAEQHLLDATKERSLYNAKVKDCKDAIDQHSITDPNRLGNNIPDSSVEAEVHYSFDFAQQIHYPHDPMQPGPIFFKTPRKCGVFGMMTEGIPKMVIFLLDEATNVGKGANCVISLLDFFFDNYGLKETVAHLHADNCSGQNKNNAMVQYLSWRVLTGRHSGVKLSFMLAGHTKFAPDSMFGLFKRKFRSTKVDCLADIEQVAVDASPREVLLTQLCGNEAGDVIVPVRQWDTYLSQFYRKLPEIKPLHHIEFLQDGSVNTRYMSESNTVSQNILKCDRADVGQGKPEVIVPKGLNEQRVAYLYNDIREFVSDECKDLVCPKPAAAMDVDQQRDGPPEDVLPVPVPQVATPTPGRGRAAPNRGRGRPKKTPRGRAAKRPRTE